MNKVIYLATTYKCSACKCQEQLLKEALNDRQDIKLIVDDYKNIPYWITLNIVFTDFPITILIDDNVIKYNFIGTMSVKKIKQLLEDLNF